MEKNVPLKDFALVGAGLIIEPDDDNNHDLNK